jgi:PD-(D/E)XK nuclease superfamily
MMGRLPRIVRVAKARVDHRRIEHEAILGCLCMWRGFLQGIVRGLASVPSISAAATRSTILLRQCNAMLGRLAKLEQLPLFENVVPRFGPLQPSHLFNRVEHYRKFFVAYQGFIRGIGNVDGDFLRLPLRRTFDLYEQWCFLRLARAAAEEAGPNVDYRQAFEEVPDRSGLLLAIKGKAFRFGTFVFAFKPQYREVWKSSGPVVGSFSRSMEPDIAFESVARELESAEPVVVLDAKYRIETEIDAAILSIHSYRDALVRRSVSGDVDCRRTVRAAFLLTPQDLSQNKRPDSWQDDSPPFVFFRDGYRNVFRFGALVMRPGMGLTECRALLKTIQHLLASPDKSDDVRPLT